MDNVKICNRIGTLHFIRFPTSEMNNFLELSKKKGMAASVSTVCATGGGAFKFEDMFKNVSIKFIIIIFMELFFLIYCLCSRIIKLLAHK